MTLLRLTFSHDAWTRLSEAEQVYALRLAHLHNDLRHIRQLVTTAKNGIDTTTGIEREIALHQLLFAIRLWYGVLNEGWEVVNSRWQASGLATAFSETLSAAAKSAHSNLSRYFNRKQLVRTIRHDFAFHYRAEPIKQHLGTLGSEREHTFVSGSKSLNIFYGFAESVRNAGLLAATGEDDASTASRKFYDEFLTVWKNLDEFCKEILMTILGKCGFESHPFESDEIIDPRAIRPVIFEDEDAIIQHLRERGMLPSNQEESE